MPEAKKEFNNIKIHTQYSICEGAIKIDDLAEYCKQNKIKSIGLTDTNNLCGALEFAEKISKVGTQPIIGTQINLFYEKTAIKFNRTVRFLFVFGSSDYTRSRPIFG